MNEKIAFEFEVRISENLERFQELCKVRLPVVTSDSPPETAVYYWKLGRYLAQFLESPLSFGFRADVVDGAIEAYSISKSIVDAAISLESAERGIDDREERFSFLRMMHENSTMIGSVIEATRRLGARFEEQEN